MSKADKVKVKKENPWISHVRKTAADMNISYLSAIEHAKKTYKKQQPIIENKVDEGFKITMPVKKNQKKSMQSDNTKQKPSYDAAKVLLENLKKERKDKK